MAARLARRPPGPSAPRARTPRVPSSQRCSDAPGSLPVHPLFENPLHLQPRRQTSTHPSAPSRCAALRVSTFGRRCQPALLPAPNLPRDMPAPRLAGAHAAVPAGPASPASPPPSPALPPLPAPVRIATGGSAGRLPPPIHLFPMTLAGLEQSEPAPAGSRSRLGARPPGGRGAGRGQTPPSHPLPCSAFLREHAGRPLALHKAPGRPQTKRETDLRGRAGGRYWLLPVGAGRPALAPPGRGASPSPPTAWLRAEPPSCGPRPPPDAFVYAPHGVSAARPPGTHTQQGPAYSPRPRRGGRGASIAAGNLGEGEGAREESGDFNRGPRA